MQQITIQLPQLLSTKQAAEALTKSVAWMERARCHGGGPRYVKIGQHVRYRAQDILEFINERLVEDVA